MKHLLFFFLILTSFHLLSIGVEVIVYLITLNDTYTLGRTPLNEESARRRDLYLHNTQYSQ